MSESIAVTSHTCLAAGELVALEALVGELRAAGIDPRVSVEMLSRDERDGVVAFLAHNGEGLVGAAVPDRFDATIEVTLFMKPGAPPGAIDLLWAAVLDDAVQRHARRVLLLHDRKAPGIGRFAELHGLALDHSELMMQRPAAEGAVQSATSQLDVRRATADDLPIVARITAEEWGSLENNLARAREAVAGGVTTYYLALNAGQPVAALNIQMLDGRPWVYGFQVRAPLRGRGYGRQVLSAVLAEVWAANPGDLYLEVDPTNTVAVNLYRSLGFVELRTFDYWAKELADD